MGSVVALFMFLLAGLAYGAPFWVVAQAENVMVLNGLVFGPFGLDISIGGQTVAVDPQLLIKFEKDETDILSVLYGVGGTLDAIGRISGLVVLFLCLINLVFNCVGNKGSGIVILPALIALLSIAPVALYYIEGYSYFQESPLYCKNPVGECDFFSYKNPTGTIYFIHASVGGSILLTLVSFFAVFQASGERKQMENQKFGSDVYANGVANPAYGQY